MKKEHVDTITDIVVDNLVEILIEKKLKALGFDTTSPNFVGTPSRVSRLWRSFLTPPTYNMTDFPLRQKGGMIIVKNHECWSFCPHHLLPVRYVCKMAYIPEDKVLGLSKLAWIADDYMRFLPPQEELPSLISKATDDAIHPKGVGVVVHGEHLCMRMRGVESNHAEAVSTFMSGVFLSDHKAREEFLIL